MNLCYQHKDFNSIVIVMGAFDSTGISSFLKKYDYLLSGKGKEILNNIREIISDGKNYSTLRHETDNEEQTGTGKKEEEGEEEAVVLRRRTQSKLTFTKSFSQIQIGNPQTGTQSKQSHGK